MSCMQSPLITGNVVQSMSGNSPAIESVVIKSNTNISFEQQSSFDNLNLSWEFYAYMHIFWIKRLEHECWPLTSLQCSPKHVGPSDIADVFHLCPT